MNVSTLSAVFASELLASPILPLLLSLSSARLSKRYNLLTNLLNRHSISYIPCNAGTFVLARIAPHAETWDDEDALVGRLQRAGVMVAPGRRYYVPERGWARICFAVEDGWFQEAIRRMDAVFASIRRG